MRNVLSLFVLASSVAACGSATAPLSPPQTFDQRVEDALAQRQDFMDTNRPLTTPKDLPDSGGATYTGAIGVEVNDGLGTLVVGDLTLTTNFAPTAELITGGADNFISSDGDAYGGALDVSNSALANPFHLGTGFTADIDGTLTNADTGPVVVDGQLLGAFGTPLVNSGPVAGVLGDVRATIHTNQGSFKAGGIFIAD